MSFAIGLVLLAIILGYLLLHDESHMSSSASHASDMSDVSDSTRTDSIDISDSDTKKHRWKRPLFLWRSSDERQALRQYAAQLKGYKKAQKELSASQQAAEWFASAEREKAEALAAAAQERDAELARHAQRRAEEVSHAKPFVPAPRSVPPRDVPRREARSVSPRVTPNSRPVLPPRRSAPALATFTNNPTPLTNYPTPTPTPPTPTHVLCTSDYIAPVARYPAPVTSLTYTPPVHYTPAVPPRPNHTYLTNYPPPPTIPYHKNPYSAPASPQEYPQASPLASPQAYQPRPDYPQPPSTDTYSYHTTTLSNLKAQLKRQGLSWRAE